MIVSAVNELPLERCPALVLNADYRPLSYYPLSLWCWQDAVRDVFLDRVNIVSEYDREIRSPSFSMKLPSVISLKTFIRPSEYPNFTRFNVFLRDKFTCLYCGGQKNLTFDHLVPKSRGGITSWENVVTACTCCNVKKGNRLSNECGMFPKTRPYRPTEEQLHKNGRNFPPNFLHQSWLDYLYWDVRLEP
jgi:5-methylcytosine-specific restriction endonuclease McrA